MLKFYLEIIDFMRKKRKMLEELAMLFYWADGG